MTEIETCVLPRRRCLRRSGAFRVSFFFFRSESPQLFVDFGYDLHFELLFLESDGSTFSSRRRFEDLRRRLCSGSLVSGGSSARNFFDEGTKRVPLAASGGWQFIRAMCGGDKTKTRGSEDWEEGRNQSRRLGFQLWRLNQRGDRRSRPRRRSNRAWFGSVKARSGIDQSRDMGDK